MAWPTSTFPTTIDVITDKVDNVDDIQASDINGAYDAIEKLEAKVGVDNSDVTTSLDYKIAHINLPMTSEASATSNTDTTTINLGNVKNGDRIFVQAQCDASAGIVPSVATFVIQKSSGTATIEGTYGSTRAFLVANYIFTTSSNVYLQISGVIKVTGDGTLVLQSQGSYSGEVITFTSNDFMAFFLKKIA